MKKYILQFMSVLMTSIFALTDNVHANVGAAKPWQMGMQDAATPMMEQITSFHDLLMYIITGITIFVLLLLIYVVIRFNSKANPEPAKFTHNVPIEILWTVVPIIILVIMAIPSIKLLYYKDRVVSPEMTIKATGYQWYWGYEYPDHGGFEYKSYLIPDDEIDKSKGQKRLLSVDNPMVVPAETKIQVVVTAADVIHNFAVPSLGVKIDTVPGRLNETWMYINEPGIYYGMCSELCGKGHAFMPIEIRAVPKEEFEAWTQVAADGDVSYDEFKANYN